MKLAIAALIVAVAGIGSALADDASVTNEAARQVELENARQIENARRIPDKEILQSSSPGIEEPDNSEPGRPESPDSTPDQLSPAGKAGGVTVREANIRQNWVLLGLGSAALAGLIFGLSSSSSEATTTTN